MVDFASELTRTSTWEMLPITLFWTSRTGRELMPSSFRSWSASVKGLSPLYVVSLPPCSSTWPTYLIAMTVGAPICKSLICC